MAVPQLQLANLGEIFAQNQARQAEMDTMQLQQAEALAARDARIEKANREKLLREKLATGEVNLQSPEGFNQLLNMGVITPDQYLNANETLAAIAKNKAQGEAATRKAETAQQKLELDRQNIQSQIQNRNAQLRISAAQLGISQQNANATYMRARAAYDKDRAELLGQSAYNLKQLPPEQQGPAYQIWRQQLLANGTFEESDLPPEYDDKVVTAFALGFANKNAGKTFSVTTADGTTVSYGSDSPFAPTTSTQSSVQKEIIQDELQSSDFAAIRQRLVNPEFFSYAGRVKGAALPIAEKAGVPLSKDQKKFIAEKSAFESEVNQAFNAYRVAVTGASAAMGEINQLKKDYLNSNLSLTEFNSKLAQLEQKTMRVMEVKKKLLSQGINLDSEQGKQKLNEAWNSTSEQPTPSGGGQGGGWSIKLKQ